MARTRVWWVRGLGLAVLAVLLLAASSAAAAPRLAVRHPRVRVARLSARSLEHSSAAAAGIAVAPTVFVALQDARLSGKPVLVKSLFSRTTSVAANPDGTLSETVAAGPVQEPDSSSVTGYSPIDLSLHPVAAPGTGIVPRLADAPISFSSGGDQIAGSLAVGTHSLAMEWGSTLPAPTISGNTATYTGVQPGVNLVLAALPDGFDLRIVLTKRPTSAAVFSLPLKLSGLTAAVSAASGGLQFTNSAGVVSARADQPVMFGAPTDANGNPTQVSTAPIVVAGGKLEITPAAAFLSNPATTYPVTIDPAPNLVVTADTYVDQAHPTGTFDSNTNLKSGLAAAGQVQRSLLQWSSSSMSQLSGTTIVSASLNLYELSSHNCTGTKVDVYDLQAAWTTSTNWNTQPAKNQLWASANTDLGGGSGCPQGWVSFSTGGSGSNTLAGLIQDWANGTPPTGGVADNLEVAADVETSTNDYKKFDSLDAGVNQPYLAVTYDQGPSAVTDKWPENGQWVNNLTLPMHAIYNDSQGGSGQVEFLIENNATGTQVADGLGSTTSVGGQSTYHVPSGDLADGTTYKWEARGYDGTLDGPWSNWRTFTTDVTPPTAPSISSTSDPNQTAWYTPLAYTVNFSSTDSGSGVAGYIVSVNQHANVNAEGTLQTAATYSGSVSADGVWYVHVAAQDAAGNVGATSTFELNIGAGALLTPAEGDQSASTFTLQAIAPGGITSVKIQYRRSPNDSWVALPVGDVTDNGTGIGSWPVAINSSTHLSDVLVWNAASTLGTSNDGGVQVRANFTSSGGGVGGAVDVLYDTQPQNQASDAGGATMPLGPGSVDLVTGDFNVGASDAGVGQTPGVDRSFDSLDPGANPNGVFGPGWSSSLNLGTYVRLHSGIDASSGNYVTVYGGDGSELDFWLNGGGTGYVDAVNAPGYGLSVAGSGTSKVWTLTDPGGTQTTFGVPSGATGGPDYYATSTTPPSSAPSSQQTMGYSYAVVSVPGGSQTRPTQEVTALLGVSCTSAPLSTPGCETLTFDYAGSTGGTSPCSSSYANYQGQLEDVKYTAYDPASSGMKTVTVENYAYDSSGKLRAVCDPRLTAPLITTYAYDGSGRLSTITPPGVNAWTVTYDSNSRVTSVSTPGDPSGTEQTSVAYGVPLYGASAPYAMGAPPGQTNPVTQWAQQDVPTAAAAIFPATEVPANPPTDYTQATVYYTDQNGQLVNVAQPGGEISTTEYDQYGNVTRTLSPLNRATALAAGSQSAQVATTLDTQNTYSTDGTELLETLGPQHQVTLTDGTTTEARQDTTNTFGATSAFGQGLLTKTVQGALEPGASSDVETRTTAYDYSGQASLGLTLGQPTSITADPNGIDLIHTIKYDDNGNVTATIQPANPSGGDAHETDTTYYQAGTGSGVPACDNHPQWAGLVCQTAPAAQPGGSLPAIPTTQYTYDLYGDPRTRTDASGSTTRIWSYTYDAAGRPSTTQITGFGTALSTITQAYDPATGLPSTTTDGSNTITRTYDNLGRLKTYTDADGNQSTYTYTLDDQIASLNDGKGTQTTAYQATSEERGLPTKLVDSAAGTFTATYDADGNLTSQAYPNGITQCTTYDETDQPTQRTYIEGGTCTTPTTVLLDYTVGPSVHDQWVTQSGPLSSQQYTYDAAARLTQVQDTVSGQCTTRQYGYDADTNRTGYVQTGPGTGGACQTGTLQTIHTYDTADRLTDTGTTYDAMGDTTTLPATDNDGNQLTATYYANNRINTVTQSSITDTYTLDPIWRTSTVAFSDNISGTNTYHYSADVDAPSWISTNAANTVWTRNILGVDGMLAAEQGSGGSIVYELEDIHANVAATVDASGTLGSVVDYYEFGQPRTLGATPYGWVGGHRRATDVATGSLIMGERVYTPALGRFLQVDPIAGGSANAYDYAAQDPVGGSDLTGTLLLGAGGCIGPFIYGDFADGDFTVVGHCHFVWGHFYVRETLKRMAVETASAALEHLLEWSGVIHIPWPIRYALAARSIHAALATLSESFYLHDCLGFNVWYRVDFVNTPSGEWIFAMVAEEWYSWGGEGKQQILGLTC